MSRAQEYQSQRRRIGSVEVIVTTYRFDDRYHCTVANVDPGATVCRAEADTRDDAVRVALVEAAMLLPGSMANR
ncbi:MAG: hypothetical protein ACYS0G_11950 [Planctomycetota bacterium]|jgi:hypothetical protein